MRRTAHCRTTSTGRGTHNSPGGRRAGREFWERRHERTADADAESGPESVRAQQALRADWNTARGERFTELRQITRPTLVVNGRNDIMVPTVNSWIWRSTSRTHSSPSPRARATGRSSGTRGFCAHVARFLDSQVPFT
ncbi:alpha/beta fold hydrolase [Actinacidiphila glaucinigra]|uniref:alpha/beta fold hydrolase n=1 Tax=Actinacidiphila glaucinigra TaxID=235986 RepID=UPI003D8A038A